MPDTRPYPATPSSDGRAHGAMVDSESVIARNASGLRAANDGLGAFHRDPAQMEIGNRRNRIIGALVIALLLGAGGAYVYTMIPAPETPVVANDDLPRPGSLSESMPQNAAPATPQADEALTAPITAPPPPGASGATTLPPPSEPVQPAP